jgi:glycosyltransferase involved in cell wall biosynthesis
MRVGIITEFMEEMPTAMKIYTGNLFENLLEIADKNIEFVLIHSRKSNDPIYKKTKDLLIPFDDSNLQSKIFNAKIDVIHIPYLIYKTAPLFELFHKKVKLICTMHGVGHSKLPPRLYYDAYALLQSELTLRILEFYMKILYVRLLRWKFRHIRNKFDLMITVSNSAKCDIVRKFSITEKKIRVIYHGISEKFRPLKDEGDIGRVLEKYKIARPFILNVGGYNPVKNVVRLIKAFHKLKTKRKSKQKLVIAATQSEGIQKIINSLGLQNEVILTGLIDNNELPQLYNAADIFVFPSLHETFGMPILEAMSCGCPVITSNVSSMPEIAGDSAVLVNPYNIVEIEKAMYQVLTNEGLKKNMRKKGLERAKQFSWRKCAEEHLKVYQEVP